jgi:hypothetical protein
VFYPYIREEVFIKLNLGTAQKAVIERDISLSERIVRVEEGIKHQGDLLEKMLDQMDKRFEQVDKRFEQVNEIYTDTRYYSNIRLVPSGKPGIYHYIGVNNAYSNIENKR